MVWRLFTDDLSATYASVDSSLLQFHRFDDGVHAGADDRASAAAAGGIPVCTAVGERKAGQLCSSRLSLPGIPRAAGISIWPVADDDCRSSYVECAAILL